MNTTSEIAAERIYSECFGQNNPPAEIEKMAKIIEESSCIPDSQVYDCGMDKNQTTKAGERTLSISDQNIIEQLANAERALRYASASADYDSVIQREINDNLFRVQQTLKAARLIAERKMAELEPIIQRLPSGDAI